MCIGFVAVHDVIHILFPPRLKPYIYIKIAAMKNLCFIVCALAASGLVAQENYTIKMTVKTEGLPQEYAAMGEQEIVTYVKGDQSKTEVNSMMFSSTVWYDGKTLTSLTDATGNKTGFTATKEELESDKDKKEEKPKITYVDEKKTIAGYECSKAIFTTTDKDKKNKETIVWYTEKIKTNPAQRKRPGRSMDFGDLKGHPLAMEMTQDYQGTEMKIVMTTTEVLTTPIDDSVFTVNTEGYKMMTYAEMKERMKTMGRGGN
jgi:hypothetical protein